MTLNIFSTLSKYNSATNENYLTESLVYLAQLFLDEIPEIGLAFINMLCCLTGENPFEDVHDIKISTQVNTDAGKPDIEIRDGNSVIFIEVKHDSPLGVKQLERYKTELNKLEVENTALVLLTRSRYSNADTTLKSDDYSRLYWFEIHKWLSDIQINNLVCDYFSRDFVDFLEEKQMSLKQITPEYMLGIPALLNLTEMLRAAITTLRPGIKITKTGGWDWRGFYLPGDYWVGVRYSKNMLITFESERGYGSVAYKQSLNMEDLDFFSLNNNEQFEVLVEFLKKALSGINNL